MLLQEAALLHDWGDPSIMNEQVAHMLEMAERPGVEIRYIPSTVPHLAFQGPFNLVEIDESETLAYVEHLDGSRWVTNTEAVNTYRQAARAVLRSAVPLQERAA